MASPIRRPGHLTTPVDGQELHPLTSGSVRILVERVGVEIDTIRKDNRSTFRVDPDLGKHLWIVEGLKDAALANDVGAKIDLTTGTVGKGQLDHEGINDTD